MRGGDSILYKSGIEYQICKELRDWPDIFDSRQLSDNSKLSDNCTHTYFFGSGSACAFCPSLSLSVPVFSSSPISLDAIKEATI
jgi:hypothetical protein